MPLIVVVFPGVQASVPELEEPPTLSGTIRLPVPPLTNTGPVLPVPPVALGVWLAPALGVRPLPPGGLEFPQAIEPSSAMPVHKEKGRVFISDFLRSIWVRHPRRWLVGSRTSLSAEGSWTTA